MIDLPVFAEGALSVGEDLLRPGTQATALAVDQQELLVDAQAELVLIWRAHSLPHRGGWFGRSTTP